MGDIYLSKPDLLLERENVDCGHKFVLETFSSQEPDSGNIALKDDFRKQQLDKIVTRKNRQDFLDDIVFHLSVGKKLPADTTPEQRANEMELVLNNKETKLRFIFSTWPRPEQGPTSKPGDPPPYKDMTPANSILGKMTPNGNQFWGATLFDFYFVQRIYNQPERHSISTGSKLAKWAKANGETGGLIKTSLEWAEDEEDPELIAPYDIQQLVQQREDGIRYNIIARQTDEEQEDHGDKDGDGETKPVGFRLPEQWPPESVFDPDAYPKGWPTEAFGDNSSYNFRVVPVLQNYIPQHRLPEKLIVHDPSDVLDCFGRYWTYSSEYPADAGPTVTYQLKLSEKYADRRKADEEKEKAQEAHAKRVLESFLANPHSSLERPDGFEMFDLQEPGWTKPAIFVVFPSRPPLKRPDEAHLYLSPSHLIGQGSHSRVYHAEMVVPRSWLVHDVMCTDCVKEDVKKILEEEDGPDGERRLKQWDEKTGMVVRNEIRKRPVSAVKEWDDIGTVTYVMQEAVNRDILAYEGPYRVVQTRVEYQNLERGPLCVHLSRGMPHLYPLATKVRLAAKLTIQRDLRMHKTEAENYQRFPKHFFEHWSGFNIWWPMREPVPVGPLVPQFYGYYVPKDKSNKYQSPILLIEECGNQVVASGLSADNRNECLSLGFRMNSAGWYHGSFFQRNILKQRGPLNESPYWRKRIKKNRNGYDGAWSFRLIDFGRSCHVDDSLSVHEGLERETNTLRRWWKSETTYWG